MDVYLNGIGTYLPRRVITNPAISLHAGVSADWIHHKTGLLGRYRAAPEDSTRQMASVAALEALAQAGLGAEEVELVVCASAIHDHYPVSSTAEDLAAQLGLRQARTIDISTPFSGFLVGLELVQKAVEAEGVRVALLVGVEGFGEGKRMRDRRTCYLFSDGAGALVLSPVEGFARLERVRRGGIPLAVGKSTDELGHLAWYGGRQPGFEGGVRAALEGTGGERNEAIHVITQRVGAPITDLADRVRARNTFQESGHFLSAAIPLSLHHLLRDEALTPGERGMLFAMNARGSWTASTLELLRRPAWPLAASRGGVPDGGEARPLAEDVPALALEELESRIAVAVEAFPSHLGNLIGLGLRLSFGSVIEDRGREQAGREITLLLQRHTRRTDSLFRIQGTADYAILLRYVLLEDVDRLGDRLRQQLEHLDLAGEMQLDVSVQITVCGDKSPAAFAREMVVKLGA